MSPLILVLPAITVAMQDTRRVPLAGLVNTVCFDKTGTLTEPGAVFQTVIPVPKPGMILSQILTSPAQLPIEFKVGALNITCVVPVVPSARMHAYALGMLVKLDETSAQVCTTPLSLTGVVCLLPRAGAPGGV